MTQFEDKTLDDVIVILTSAGKGTRNRPINLYTPTSMIPKGLLRLLGTPISEVQVKQLAREGLKNFYIITQYLENDDMLSNRFGDGRARFGVNINYSSPLEDLLNNGSGESLLRNVSEHNFGGHSIVLANDNLYQANWPELVKLHKEKGAVITIMATMMNARETIGNYGLLAVDANGRVVRITEKPETEAELMQVLGISDTTQLSDTQVWVNTAGYILHNAPFKDLAKIEWVIKRMKKESGEFDMSRHLIKGCIEAEIPVYAILIDNWGDLGTNSKYLATVERALASEFPSIDLLLNNAGYVHIENNVWVHPETYASNLKDLIETDRVDIGPNVFIGRHVTIDKGSKIKYSTIEKRANIGWNATVSHSVIFPGCLIGDCARIDRSILGLRVIVESSEEKPTLIESNSYLGPVTVPSGYHLIRTSIFPAYEFVGQPRVIRDQVLRPSRDTLKRVVNSYINGGT